MKSIQKSRAKHTTPWFSAIHRPKLSRLRNLVDLHRCARLTWHVAVLGGRTHQETGKSLSNPWFTLWKFMDELPIDHDEFESNYQRQYDMMFS